MATVNVVSVWPKPSMSFIPVSLYHCSNTLGFRASPAMVQYLSDDRSNLLMSSLIRNRNTVGGAQNEVMPYF